MKTEQYATYAIASILSILVNNGDVSTINGITVLSSDNGYVFDHGAQQIEKVNRAYWRPTGSTGVA
ncbi:hypothetical protein AB833_02000 [Chromatiales bacterium (ex Bugula neritina AB1)]|nr:hypothetical protein AB833_02000 [Chromatiales bacterium (ex Bugula neritina AB1)]